WKPLFSSPPSKTHSSPRGFHSRGGWESRSGGNEMFGDLHGVQRGALAQVVAHREEQQRVVVEAWLANTPDEHVVDPGSIERRGKHFVLEVVHQPDAGSSAKNLP